MEEMYGQQYGQQQQQQQQHHPFSSSSSLSSASSSTPQPQLDYFPIDDLLDLSNDRIFSNSSSSADSHPHSYFPPPLPPPAAADFSNALGFSLPSEDVAELEWLSRFVDDSFADFPPPMIMPQLPGNNDKPFVRAANSKPVYYRDDRNTDGMMRRCTHCASEKTPQWRTGPTGPKTLCNACGVRYKSGRLVPEYRPAASPTFVLTQHSNSHRKVMELRRQKEVVNSPSPSQQQAEEEEEHQRRFYLHSNGFQVC